MNNTNGGYLVQTMMNILAVRGNNTMNVVVHYSTNEFDMTALRKSIAQIHTQAVISYIDKLKCSDSQKLRLVTAVKDRVMSA